MIKKECEGGKRMTKEEKVQKALEYLEMNLLGSERKMVEGLIDAIEEEEPEEEERLFLENEVVGIWGEFFFKLYCDVKAHTDKKLLKLTPEVLAATVGARIPGAKWAAVDEDGVMYFYKDEPTLEESEDDPQLDPVWIGQVCRPEETRPYIIHCPVADWKKAKWRLE